MTRPRNISAALPPLNIEGKKLAKEIRARLEGDFERAELKRIYTGRDDVANDIMTYGNNLEGRRALKKAYALLEEDDRKAREVELATYSGFRFRSDGTFDYGANPIFNKKYRSCGCM